MHQKLNYMLIYYPYEESPSKKIVGLGITKNYLTRHTSFVEFIQFALYNINVFRNVDKITGVFKRIISITFCIYIVQY